VRGARIVAFPALVSSLLIACGQTGPLYLPRVPAAPPAAPAVQPVPAAPGNAASVPAATDPAARPNRSGN